MFTQDSMVKREEKCKCEFRVFCINSAIFYKRYCNTVDQINDAQLSKISINTIKNPKLI